MTDPFGVIVRLVGKDNKVFFVEPCDSVLPWITDRARLSFEGAFTSVLSEVKIAENSYNNLSKVFNYYNLFRYCTPKSMGYFTIVFKRLNLEVCNLLNVLEKQFSFLVVRSETPFLRNNDFELSYQLPSFSMTKLSMASLVVLISINTRYESYVMNLNLRKFFLTGGFKLAVIGPKTELTAPLDVLGSTSKTVSSVSEGSNFNCQRVCKSNLPIFLTNTSFFRASSSHILSSMLSTLNQSCLSLGNLFVMADKLETTGVYNLGKFNHMTSEMFLKSKIIFYLNADCKDNPELNSILNHKLLSHSSFELAEKFFIEHSDNVAEGFSLPQTLRSKNEVSKFSYLNLITKNYFEEFSTYLDAEGSFKKVTRIAGEVVKKKGSWESVKQLQILLQNSVSFANAKDTCLINFLKTEQKRSFGFLSKISSAITSSAVRLEDKTSTVNDLCCWEGQFKLKPTFYRNYKLKFWLDDFFIGGNKDLHSKLSPTLIKSSKMVRFFSKNFF